MRRIRTATVAAALVTALTGGTALAADLKPKFGDIGGVYYTEVAGNREACRQAIGNKIALCGQNTNFAGNTKNRKYKGCLPIFKRQAESCAVHFRHQMSKCDLSGAARITDFTGFGCEATKTVVEEGGGPDIAPLDRRMAARTRVNLRAGPGTNHRVVGSLAAGQTVQATGRAGDWLRIARPGGGTAFVHGDFMVASAGSQAPAQQGHGPAAGPSPKCAGMGKGASCWLELANKPGCYVFDSPYIPATTATWSGACSQGVGVGRGTLVRTLKGKFHKYTGTLSRGKARGRWVERWATGAVVKGPYVEGKRHGQWVKCYSDGSGWTYRYSHGKFVKGSLKDKDC